MSSGRSESVGTEPLRRLLASGGSLPTWKRGREEGAFGSKTPAAQRSLETLVSLGLVRREDDAGDERLVLEPAGRAELLRREGTLDLLEDLVRAADRAGERLERMEAGVRRQRELLRDQTGFLRRLLADPHGVADPDERDARLLDLIEEMEDGLSPGAADPTLAELMRRALAVDASWSIGLVHDSLRRLHAAERIRLSPWTGPLYGVPEPAVAMLIGHEVLYYVRLRTPA